MRCEIWLLKKHNSWHIRILSSSTLLRKALPMSIWHNFQSLVRVMDKMRWIVIGFTTSKKSHGNRDLWFGWSHWQRVSPSRNQRSHSLTLNSQRQLITLSVGFRSTSSQVLFCNIASCSSVIIAFHSRDMRALFIDFGTTTTVTTMYKIYFGFRLTIPLVGQVTRCDIGWSIFGSC